MKAPAYSVTPIEQPTPRVPLKIEITLNSRDQLNGFTHMIDCMELPQAYCDCPKEAEAFLCRMRQIVTDIQLGNYPCTRSEGITHID